MEDIPELNAKSASIKDSCTSSMCLKKDSDPGAARLGNFINYYQFNPPSERLSHLFPKKLYNELELCATDDHLVCLDVGCNSGVSKSF